MPRDPHVSNRQAAEAADGPTSFHWLGEDHEIALRWVVFYDRPDVAEAVAAHLGTYAKHAGPKFDNAHWKTFSVVPLP